MRWHRALALFVAAAVLGVACGSDSGGLSAPGAATLHEQVTEARSAAEGGDSARVRAALDRVDQTVARLEADDDISPARADEVRAALHDVRAGIDAWVASTSTTLPPTTTPPPPTGDHREPKKHPDPGKGPEKNRD